MNLHEPPISATASATRSPTLARCSINSLGFRSDRERTNCWGCVELLSHLGKNIDAGIRLVVQQGAQIVTIDYPGSGRGCSAVALVSMCGQHRTLIAVGERE